MSNKNLHTQLDKAIEQMDTTQIDALLQELENSSPTVPFIEDSKLFAKRIIKNKSILKGYDCMKIISKKRSAIVASITLVLVATTSVLYATGILSQITIFKEDATYTISSDTPLTEEQANALIEDLDDTPPSSENTVSTVSRTYDSLEEASQDLNVPLTLPTILPEGFTLSKSMDIESYEVTPGHFNTNIYLNFDNPTNDPTADIHTQKLFAISVLKSDNTGVSQSILKTDSIYDHIYTNALGDTYTILTEEGAILAKITLGDIDYILGFMNISEEEIYNTIDHTDLSIYKK